MAFVGLVVFLVSLIGTAQAAAQEQPQFVAQAESVLVSFEVVVEGPDGPILGLVRDDFEILHDGRRVELTHFASFAAPPSSTPSEPPAVAGGVPPTPLPEAREGVLVCYYVDNENLTPLNRTKVLNYVERHVRDTLRAPDRAMVVSFERRPRVVTPFTWSPDRIAASLGTLGSYVGRRVADNAERADLQGLINQSRPGGRGRSNLGEMAMMRTRTFAIEQRSQLMVALRGLRGVLTMLGALPGRKRVVYVSDGLASTPGEDLFLDLARQIEDPTVASAAYEFQSWSLYDEAARAAAAAGVAIDAIDARGLMAPGGDAARRTDSNRDWEWHRRAGTQETLQYLADQTGGVAVVDSNDFGGGLKRISRAQSTYYSLGYPLPLGEKRQHEVKVILRGHADVTLRYRRRFVERSAPELTADRVLAGLAFDLADNALGVAAAVGATRPVAKGRWEIPLKVSVPLERLLLAPSGGQHAGQVTLYVATREEEKGEESPLIQQLHPILIAEAEFAAARGGAWPIHAVLAVKPGRYRISVGVRDESSGLAGFALAHATAGSP
jgi:VWFA-related protein